MKKLRISSTFVAMLAVALIAVGCNENEDPITPGDAPNKPSNLQATSGANTGNTGRILLKWTAPTSSATVSLAGYELTYTPGGTTPISIGANQTSYTVENLTVGTPYVFTLKSKGSNGELSSGTQITWAPARRSDVIRIYGSESSQGSGLDLDGGTGGAPQVLTIANGGQWDLAFDDKDNDTVGIASPGQSLYVNNQYKFPNGDLAKKTYVSTTRVTGITNLDQVFESAALDAGIVEQLQRVDNINQPFAFVAKTAEGNYAKILVLANGGQIVQGSGNNKYIEVIVSYQPTINVPYALPGNSNNSDKLNNTVQRRASREMSTK